jgi:glycosyltransferase involved in cell wall biosynthesis
MSRETAMTSNQPDTARANGKRSTYPTLESARTIAATDRVMKLIIQIPCFNEAESLPATLAALPRSLPGFAKVEWLVIDDGSTDRTVEVARAYGVDHIVRHSTNRGLARTFMTGLEAALKAGADVIVNTDADNQYDARDIPALVEPILSGSAQIVVGARPIREIGHFSPLKKFLQYLGSWMVRVASGTDIPDSPSGFRAYHREAAQQLIVTNTYTYTLETVIQAGRKGIPITWVQVRVNPDLRPSRLMTSVFDYIRRSAITIIRIFMLYKPLRFFTLVAFILAVPGIIGILRFLGLYAMGEGSGNIQSLVISGALVGSGVIVQIGGLLADLVAVNRILLEDIRSRQLRTDVEQYRARIDQLESRPDRVTAMEHGGDHDRVMMTY